MKTASSTPIIAQNQTFAILGECLSPLLIKVLPAILNGRIHTDPPKIGGGPKPWSISKPITETPSRPEVAS
ncbi:hypothetical protein GCM10011571_22230 [Marinithermofilum abyssi]|uniref:Uncharacterized protein n=1 Tax=Marinithermofilum abyssi TaxID=1571185 RepID=A0A8J2VIE5_9BACL|nr:hypothetical protein GCM10011571_22230 [Marinithermofilum abyssi]